MLVNQRTHNLYFFYYCDFYISPLKENKSTSNSPFRKVQTMKYG